MKIFQNSKTNAIFMELKKYYKVILVAVITLLLFFANLFSPLWIVAVVLTGVLYLFLNLGEVLACTMYFNMFSGIETFYIASILVGLGLTAIRYFWKLYKGQARFYILPCVLSLGFCLVFSLVSIRGGSFSEIQGWLVVALLVAFYFIFALKDELDIDLAFKFMIIGLLVSLVLSVVSVFIANFKLSIYYFDGTYKRLKLFCYYPNNLAVLCLFAISYYVYKLISGKGKAIVNCVVVAGCVAVGLCTLSKAFIAVLLFIMLYLIVYLIKKYKLKSLKIIIPAILVCVAFCLIFHNLVEKTINRLFVYSSEGSLIYKITTGRSEIWKKYLEKNVSSAKNLLVGVGLFGPEVVDVGPHSVPIYFAYKTGLVGIAVLCLLAYSYYRESNGLKITYENILPLAVFVIVSIEEMIFSDRFFLFLIYGIMLLSKEKTQNPQKICEKHAKNAEKIENIAENQNFAGEFEKADLQENPAKTESQKPDKQQDNSKQTSSKKQTRQKRKTANRKF